MGSLNFNIPQQEEKVCVTKSNYKKTQTVLNQRKRTVSRLMKENNKLDRQYSELKEEYLKLTQRQNVNLIKIRLGVDTLLLRVKIKNNQITGTDVIRE